MKRKLRIKVTEGEIVLESISILQDTRDLIVVYVDTRSKYPSLECCSERGIQVGASDRTLRGNRGMKGVGTLIDIIGLRGRWQTAFDVGRYSVTWVLYKIKKAHKSLWWNID